LVDFQRFGIVRLPSLVSSLLLSVLARDIRSHRAYPPFAPYLLHVRIAASEGIDGNILNVRHGASLDATCVARPWKSMMQEKI
jgi:hypothetical protein